MVIYSGDILDTVNSFKDKGVSDDVMYTSLYLANKISKSGIRTIEVFLTGNNSIQFEREDDIVYKEVEIFSDGTVGLFYQVSRGDEIIYESKETKSSCLDDLDLAFSFII